MNDRNESKTNNKTALNSLMGKSFDRVDGRLKVTGMATYAAEHKLAKVAHGVLVPSKIARGRIRSIDDAAARKASGVLLVLTHLNMPKLAKPGDAAAVGTMPGEERTPFFDDSIHHAGQYVALVVAESLEEAEYAAQLIKFDYDEQPPGIVLEKEKNGARAEKPELFFGFEEIQIKRGNGAANLNDAAVKVTNEYSTPNEHHNPIEPLTVIAEWQNANQTLTLYDTTQAVVGSQKIAAGVFGFKDEQVHIVSPFVGGGFGCKGLVWWHPIIAAVAARELNRPVKIALTRQQMFTSNGHRGETRQTVKLGANNQGKFDTIFHETVTAGSEIGAFLEPCGLTTKMLYAVPNLEIAHTLVRLNVGTPTPMRAPGESPGTFALESALDELAVELKIDPLQLRLINHADKHPHDGREWSSKNLKECYRVGAEKFGWSRRKQQPRQIKDGKFLIGMGMATATYPGYRSPATARATINSDGSALIQTATQDIGTGTYTALTIIAADALGFPIERVNADFDELRSERLKGVFFLVGINLNL